MQVNDILFLKHDERHAQLEELVRKEAELNSLKFLSLPMLQTTESDLNAKVLFYDPPDPTIFQAQLQLQALRLKSPVVVVYGSSLEETVRSKISSPDSNPARDDSTSQKAHDVHFARSDSTPQQVHALFDQLKRYIQLDIPPLAFVISARDPKPYREALSESGFRVQSIDQAQFNPGEIAHYSIDKGDVSLIVIEGEHLKSLSEVVEANFPNARITVFGDDAHVRAGYNRGFASFKRDHNTGKTLREFAKREYAKRQKSADGATGHGPMGTCYILAGPTSAGKTEAGMRIEEVAKEFKRDVYVIKKHTTRPRRPGEEQYKHLVTKTPEQMRSLARGRKYFVSYRADNNGYGVPMEIQDVLNRGDDAILTWTDYDTLPMIVDNLEKRIGPGTAVAILFYADANTLKARLINRPADMSEKERRFPKIDEELKRYFESPNVSKFFKYAINTSHYQDSNEVRRILKAILHWEAWHKSENYCDTILKSIFPSDFFSKVIHSEPVTLQIPDKIMEEYALEKGIPLNMFNSLKSQKVICVSDAYGHVGVWLQPQPEFEKRYSGRDMMLDLIERTVKFEPRYRNNFRNMMNYSLWAKCGDTLTAFNDGLLYMLGDDLYERPMAGAERYAVSFGYIKTRGSFFRANPLRRGEIDSLQSEMKRMRMFPLSPQGNL